MLSSRYAWAAAAMLVFALIPTVLNVYRSPEPLDAGTLAQEIPTEIEPFGAPAPGTRDAEWVTFQFATPDFVSRKYAGTYTRELTLFAARNHDPKKLFHFPELALCYGKAESARRMETIGEFPVHVLEFGGGNHIAKYVLLYGDEGVGDPIAFMLGRLPRLFVGQREAMTLVFVHAAVHADEKEAVAAELNTLLAAVCRGTIR